MSTPLHPRRRLGRLAIVGLASLAIAFGSGPGQAHAQNKMRKLNSREKEALTDFQKKKDDKDEANKSDKKKGGKGFLSFLKFGKGKKGGKEAGLNHAMKIQEKGVRKRMRQNKRKAKNW